MQHTGLIFQINVSNGGVPKLPVESAVVNQRGITTDRQADLRAHGSLDQALCIYSAELLGKLRAEGHRVYAGCLGENITTEGLEWRLMTPGTRVRLGAAVVAEITDYASPCNKNARWFLNGDFGRISEPLHPGWGRVYAKVIEGGEIRPGDPIIVQPEDAILRVQRRSVPAVRWPRDFGG